MNLYDVFVYGTLRKRGTNHHVISKSPCIQANYIIRGYCLYDYQHWYPYMIERLENDQVIGEIYRVDQQTLKQLDILEDVKNKLYKLIFLPNHQCYTYIKYDKNVDGLPRIASGNWIEYIKSLELS